MAHVALITGATGEDGAYLAELLLAKNYTVHRIGTGADGDIGRLVLVDVFLLSPTGGRFPPGFAGSHSRYELRAALIYILGCPRCSPPRRSRQDSARGFSSTSAIVIVAPKLSPGDCDNQGTRHAGKGEKVRDVE